MKKEWKFDALKLSGKEFFCLKVCFGCFKLLFDIAKICLCAASEAKAIYFVPMVFQYDGASIETEPLTCCPMVAL